MRLDKFLSEMGLCSRKEASIACRKGEVLCNQVPAKRADMHIDPERDRIVFRGAAVDYAPFLYFMLNKPEGYISATEDGNLPTVLELIPPEMARKGLFPCGRLDRDTVGFLLLTTDGKLGHYLLSPRHHVEKVYRATLEAPLCAEGEAAFARGMTLDGGELCLPAVLSCDGTRTVCTVTLREGKYHQIKRMFEALGNRVLTLERIAFGGIPLDPSLARGEFRPLTDAELAHLRSLAPKE